MSSGSVRVAALAFLSCLGPAACGGPGTYGSRVEFGPLHDRLTASGGDASRILRPGHLDELRALEPGRRYRFVVLEDGSLAIAPLPWDQEGNEYVHPILAGGGRVLTAGAITVIQGSDPLAVTIDQDSKSFCPSFASLDAAVRALVALGADPTHIERVDHPPDCAPL